MRLIDADELLNKFCHGCPDNDNGDNCIMNHCADYDLVVTMPTIEAEPVKHGTWGENIYGYRKCSVCGRVTQVDECMREPMYMYCPYCGARMDEVEK